MENNFLIAFNNVYICIYIYLNVSKYNNLIYINYFRVSNSVVFFTEYFLIQGASGLSLAPTTTKSISSKALNSPLGNPSWEYKCDTMSPMVIWSMQYPKGSRGRNTPWCAQLKKQNYLVPESLNPWFINSGHDSFNYDDAARHQWHLE